VKINTARSEGEWNNSPEEKPPKKKPPKKSPKKTSKKKA
jgi:hypothetical protein